MGWKSRWRIPRPLREQLFELFLGIDKLNETVSGRQSTVTREPKPVGLLCGQSNDGSAARQAGLRPAAEAAEVSGGAGGQGWARAPLEVDDAVDRMINPAQTEGGSAHRRDDNPSNSKSLRRYSARRVSVRRAI